MQPDIAAPLVCALLHIPNSAALRQTPRLSTQGLSPLEVWGHGSEVAAETGLCFPVARRQGGPVGGTRADMMGAAARHVVRRTCLSSAHHCCPLSAASWDPGWQDPREEGAGSQTTAVDPHSSCTRHGAPPHRSRSAHRSVAVLTGPTRAVLKVGSSWLGASLDFLREMVCPSSPCLSSASLNTPSVP